MCVRACVCVCVPRKVRIGTIPVCLAQSKNSHFATRSWNSYLAQDDSGVASADTYFAPNTYMDSYRFLSDITDTGPVRDPVYYSAIYTLI